MNLSDFIGSSISQLERNVWIGAASTLVLARVNVISWRKSKEKNTLAEKVSSITVALFFSLAFVTSSFIFICNIQKLDRLSPLDTNMKKASRLFFGIIFFTFCKLVLH